MLNEFKKQMWNDGPAKQPWLNYFNEYERTHCCFGDDGSDVGTADDEAFNTSSKAARDASTEQSSGMSADQAQAVSDAIDEAQKAGASVTEMQNIAEGGNRAAEAGYTGQDLQTVAAANIDTDFFSPDNTYGVGSGFTSGVGSFADPFSDSGVGQTSFGSYVSDLGTAAEGLYSLSSIGVLSDVISSIAKEKGKPEAEVTQAEIDAVTSGVGPGAGIGEFSDVSPAQVAVATGLESVGPGFNRDMAAGFGDRDTAISWGMLEDANQRVTDLVSDLQRDRDEKEDELGFSLSYQSPEERAAALSLDKDIAAYRDAEDFINELVQDNLARQMNPNYASQVAADRNRPALSADVLDAIAREKSEKAKTTSPFDDEFSGPRDISYGERDPGATYNDVNLQAGLRDDQAQMFGGGYATESGRRDAMNAVETANMISAYKDAENAMFGGGYARTGFTPDIAFEEIEGDEPIILPKKKEEEKEEPKSAMAQYFERLGVPSPYAPSTTQSASPYLSAVAAQPAGAPEDLFARMARIRRREALKTPKFNYAGFAPFSPNLYAAAYGISPEEARRRIPALPKLKQTIGFPDEDETTEAYGGGGLRNLIRRQTGGPTFDPEQTARDLQRLRIAQLETAPQTAAERIALQKQKGFYRDEEGYARDSEGNVVEDFGYQRPDDVPESIDVQDDKPKVPKTGGPFPEPVPIDVLDKQDPIDVQDPTGDPLLDTVVYNPIPDDVTTLPTFQPPGLGGPFTRPEYNPFTDYTGPKTMADLGNKGRGGSHFTPEFTQYLEGQGYTIDMTPTYVDGAPRIINQQGQLVDFNKPMMLPAGVQGLGPSSTIGPQLQPTGLQGLQQNMQGFGMQSPVPFGTQQPFSSGFSKFGQPMMGQTLRGIGF